MLKVILGIVLSGFVTFAMAQARPPYGGEVTLDQAKKIAAATVAESQKNGWRMAVAIVDNHGFLVYFERMADTQTASVDVAVDKAKAAAMFRRPTKAFDAADHFAADHDRRHRRERRQLRRGCG